MLSWKLWRAICAVPQHHPVFEVVRIPYMPRRRWTRVLILAALMICPTAYSVALFWPSVYPVLFAVHALPTLYSIILAGITVYLLTIATGISTRVAGMRESGLYHLLATAPDGGFVAVWNVSMAGLHRNSAFRWFRFGLNLVAFTMIVGLAAEILLPLVAMARSGTAAFYPVLLDVAAGWLLAVTFYLDTTQSLILASLLGMVAPFYTVSVPGAALWSAGVFLLAQTGVYFTALVGGSMVFRALEPIVLPVKIGALAWAIVALLAARHFANRYLWHALQRHTATTPDDLHRWADG